jgi:hypothetical protein
MSVAASSSLFAQGSRQLQTTISDTTKLYDVRDTMELIRAFTDGSKTTITHAGPEGKGFSAFDGTQWHTCSGLLPRLSRRVFPRFARDRNDAARARPKAARAPGQFPFMRRGGSSRATGISVDDEVAHAIECGSLAELIADPPVPNKAKSRKKYTRCPKCQTAIISVRTGEARLSTRTQAYIRDCKRLGIRLIASQVPVAMLGQRLATALDDIGIFPDGTLVLVERKSGYQSATQRPEHGEGRVIFVQTDPNDTRIAIQNHIFSYHQLQVALGAAMWNRTTRRQMPPILYSVVVYVDGRSNTPWKKGTGPDLLARRTEKLECIWAWTPDDLISAADKLLPVL